MKRLSSIILAAALLVAAPSFAQQVTYPVGGAPQGQRSQGMTMMCMNSAGLSVPLALCDQWPAVAPSYQGALAEQRARVVTISPNSGSPNAYPSNATPITGIGTGSTGAVVGTLSAVPGRTTYICGVDVSVIGGTAAVGPIVIAGLVGGSFTYQASSTAAGGLALTRTFTPCIPASAANTAITTTTTADGTATATDVNSWGYRQ